VSTKHIKQEDFEREKQFLIKDLKRQNEDSTASNPSYTYLVEMLSDLSFENLNEEKVLLSHTF
jgi:hypothetical protein